MWSVRVVMVGWALGASALAEPLRETRVEHAGARFRVLRAAPEQVEVMWKNDKGEAYRTFDRIQAALTMKGKNQVESNAFGAVFVITEADPTSHKAPGIEHK